MRFRDEISGRFVPLEVALSNPDLVIPLDNAGRPSPSVAIEWARIVTEIVVQVQQPARAATSHGSGGSGGGFDDLDDYPPDDLMWGGEEDLGEEDMY